MADAAPLLLLDVDGVLNPYAAETCPMDYQEHLPFEGEEPVRLRTRHGGWTDQQGRQPGEIGGWIRWLSLHWAGVVPGRETAGGWPPEMP